MRHRRPTVTARGLRTTTPGATAGRVALRHRGPLLTAHGLPIARLGAVPSRRGGPTVPARRRRIRSGGGPPGTVDRRVTLPTNGPPVTAGGRRTRGRWSRPSRRRGIKAVGTAAGCGLGVRHDLRAIGRRLGGNGRHDLGVIG
jgi:hypothetical protein